VCTREASQLKSISKVNTGPKARTSFIFFYKWSKLFDFVEWAHDPFRASHLYSVFVRLDEIRLLQNFTVYSANWNIGVHYFCCLLTYIDPCALPWCLVSLCALSAGDFPFPFSCVLFVFLRAYLQETGRIMATMDLDGDGTVWGLLISATIWGLVSAAIWGLATTKYEV